ncbi:hypothetical protein HDU96_009043 [Phlyctochytrium bullatum]|nr:hypothetical protein HDU96_009043 [Phlyctochytrium bullatum]
MSTKKKEEFEDGEQKVAVEEDPSVLFDGQKKKKKKKKAFEVDEAEPEEQPAAKPAEPETEGAAAEEPAEDGGFDFGEKKKKKKKAVKLPDEDAEATTPADGEGEAFDFGEKKKKKSKKKPDIADFEAQLRADGIMDEAGQDQGAAGGEEGGDPWSESNRDYTYKELLTRVFQILRQNNPDLAGEKKRYTLVPPQVMREGSKKTMFANVVEISKRFEFFFHPK